MKTLQELADGRIILTRKSNEQNPMWMVFPADNGWNDWVCSVCGWRTNLDIHVSLGYNFCPNCGSKMERTIGVRYKDVKESIENFITEFVPEVKEKAPDLAEEILGSRGWLNRD